MQTILISRTDAIGDVVLTLPLAGVLRKQLPESRIVFLCATYTRPVVECCEHVDAVIDWNELATLPEADRAKQLRAVGADAVIHVFPRSEIARAAWKAGIKKRIGTTHRLYHFRYCNKLVGLGRKKSPHHEALLNLLLAQSLLPDGLPGDELWRYYGLTRIPEVPVHLREYIRRDKFNLVLHPKSRGSSVEWEPARWQHLISLLPKDRYNIILTGTAEEGKSIREAIGLPGEICDLTGKMTLSELLSVLQACDGLVAASTGPLHLAAALDRHTLGLFPDVPPLHPGRWGPIGRKAEVLAGSVGNRGFIDIEVENVFKKLMSWLV